MSAFQHGICINRMFNGLCYLLCREKGGQEYVELLNIETWLFVDIFNGLNQNAVGISLLMYVTCWTKPWTYMCIIHTNKVAFDLKVNLTPSLQLLSNSWCALSNLLSLIPPLIGYKSLFKMWRWRRVRDTKIKKASRWGPFAMLRCLRQWKMATVSALQLFFSYKGHQLSWCHFLNNNEALYQVHYIFRRLCCTAGGLSTSHVFSNQWRRSDKQKAILDQERVTSLIDKQALNCIFEPTDSGFKTSYKFVLPE